MFAIVWKYQVTDANAVAFERAYGPEGEWVRLFRTAPGFVGTDLVRGDQPGVYVTIDRWHQRDDFDRFLEHHREPYDRLDREFESLTESEELIARGDAVA
ncbi:MAG TPA: antibiotic biosynthesis monooxygenase [Ilumatobacteraceae bacterium]